jgi:hypothetical protein
MKVTQKMEMRDYDIFTQERLRVKIPNWHDRDWRRRLGDSIYDFSSNPPKIRKSVHNEQNRERDLGGRYALISEYFYYFGDQSIMLPDDLREIVKQGQGHRRQANEPLRERFEKWLISLNLEPNKLYGSPQLKLFGKPKC